MTGVVLKKRKSRAFWGFFMGMEGGGRTGGWEDGRMGGLEGGRVSHQSVSQRRLTRRRNDMK